MMKKEATINTPELSIVGNAMAWKNSVIFLSNISSISTIPLESIPFPMWALAIFILGLICLFKFTLIGFGLLLLGGMGIAGWFFENNEAQSQRKLIILTNAGVTYSFIFRDLEFLDKVYAVLISSMAENRRAGQNIKINIKNSQISGNAQILNDLVF